MAADNQSLPPTVKYTYGDDDGTKKDGWNYVSITLFEDDLFPLDLPAFCSTPDDEESSPAQELIRIKNAFETNDPTEIARSLYLTHSTLLCTHLQQAVEHDLSRNIANAINSRPAFSAKKRKQYHDAMTKIFPNTPVSDDDSQPIIDREFQIQLDLQSAVYGNRMIGQIQNEYDGTIGDPKTNYFATKRFKYTPAHDRTD